jgi:protein-L-isoaspartate O-methyltransferase
MRLTRHLPAVVLTLALVGSQSAGARQSQVQVINDDREAAELARLLEPLKPVTVADIGAGRGEFTAALAKYVASGVRIIATELPDQLANLSKGLESRGLSNVTVVEGALTETKLPDGSCDVLVLRRAYHHFDHPVEMAASLLRTLRRGGTLFLIEQPRLRLDRPEPDGRQWDGITPISLVEELQKAGFIHERTVNPFDSILYLVVMKKP